MTRLAMGGLLRQSLLVSFALVSACGGNQIPRAICNQCRGERFTVEQCQQFGETAGCDTATLISKTDDACNVGAPPQTYTACQFTICDAVPDCRE